MDNQPQSPQFDTSPEIPQKSWFSAHKILGYVFLFEALAAIVAGLYYVQTVRQIPTSYDPIVHRDATANWKTYTNAEYGFEIRYPKEFNFLERKNDFAVGFDDRDINSLDPDPTTFEISIHIDENPGQLSVKQWLSEGAYQGMSFSDQKFITVGGYPAVQTSQAPSEGGSVTETHIVEGKKVYMIRLNNSDLYRAVYSQIISTFKFVEPIVIPSDWKIYTNTKYGFSIRIPKDWGSISDYDGSYSLDIDTTTSQLALGPRDNNTKNSGNGEFKLDVSDIREKYNIDWYINFYVKPSKFDYQIKDITILGADRSEEIIINRTDKKLYSLMNKYTYLIEQDNRLYELGFYNENLANQIFSTFKFTK